MNPDIDDLVREAVRRQEKLAADPDHIRAALPARAARRRRTRTRVMLATVAAAVAVAVAVPVITLQDNGNDVPAAPATAPALSLYYRPTWLPDGMVERFRHVPIGISDPKVPMDRIWTNASAGNVSGPRVVLTSFKWEPTAADGNTPPDVDINGRPGYYVGDTLTWQADGHTKLSVSAPELGLSQEDLLRIARSVVPDPTRLRPPLRLDWLPHGITTQFLEVKGDSPTSWEATLSMNNQLYFLAASVGTTANTAAGEKITINGRPAHLERTEEPDDHVMSHVLYPTKWLLTMDLGDGRHLTVRVGTGTEAPVTRNDMIRIARNIRIDPNPDVNWLGR